MSNFLKSIKNIFVSDIIYVRIYRNQFKIKNIASGQEIILDSPESFSTNRLLVGSLKIAGPLLKKGLKAICDTRGLFKPVPILLIHPIEMMEDGISQAEEIIFLCLTGHLAVRKTIIWVGHELSDEEAISRCE